MVAALILSLCAAVAFVVTAQVVKVRVGCIPFGRFQKYNLRRQFITMHFQLGVAYRVLGRLHPSPDWDGCFPQSIVERSLLTFSNYIRHWVSRSSRKSIARDLLTYKQPGPLIRIGPHEVSFYSINVYSTVFKVGSKFRKDPRVYGEFVQGQAPALFSIT